MSHYKKVATQFRKIQPLVAALIKSGVPKEAILISEKPVPMTNFYGGAVDPSRLCRVIVVSKAGMTTLKHAGFADLASDIGFSVEPDEKKTSDVHIDSHEEIGKWPHTLTGMDRSKSSATVWLDRVKKEYDFAITAAKAQIQGVQFARIEHNNKLYCVVKG